MFVWRRIEYCVKLTFSFFLSSSYSFLELIVAALSNRAGHYIFALWFLSSFFFFLSFFSSPNLSGRRLDVCLPYFHTWCGPSANLECRSEMCCMRLAGNTGRKKSPFGTIAQLCRAISLELRQVSTIGKNLLNSNTSSTGTDKYGELRSTNSWDLLASLGHSS